MDVVGCDVIQRSTLMARYRHFVLAHDVGFAAVGVRWSCQVTSASLKVAEQSQSRMNRAGDREALDC
jgi:hypothetical protein